MKTATERLLAKATIDSQTGCIVWEKTTRDGYGLIWYRGKAVSAHRLAWQLSNGDIPMSMRVLHKCDNRACIRSDHLFLGTQRDNIQDAISKGRYDAVKYGRMTRKIRNKKGQFIKTATL